MCVRIYYATQDICTDKFIEDAWNRGGAYTSNENFDWFPPGMQNGWQRKFIPTRVRLISFYYTSGSVLLIMC